MQFAATKLSGVLPDLSIFLKLTYLGIVGTKITGVPRCDLIIPQLPLGITNIDTGTCNDGMLPPSIGRLVKLTNIKFFGDTTLGGELPSL